MFDIGGPEVLLIMFLVLLLFGADRLPELAKGIGRSVREFKKAAGSVEAEVRRAMEEPEEPTPKKFPPKPPPKPVSAPPPSTPDQSAPPAAD